MHWKPIVHVLLALALAGCTATGPSDSDPLHGTENDEVPGAVTLVAAGFDALLLGDPLPCGAPPANSSQWYELERKKPLVDVNRTSIDIVYQGDGVGTYMRIGAMLDDELVWVSEPVLEGTHTWTLNVNPSDAEDEGPRWSFVYQRFTHEAMECSFGVNGNFFMHVVVTAST